MDLTLATETWRQALSEAFTNIDDLCQYLQIQPEQILVSKAAADKFTLRVPRAYAARIKKNAPDDPLLKQILPNQHETELLPGYSDNPVGDLEAIAAPGIIHKYQGRVLLIITGHCAINCRYCFRKAFPYNDQQLGRQKLQAALNYIESDPSITEVILSGGDPLTLSDFRLGEILSGLNQIKHLRRIRIHTRIPIVLPERITENLLTAFKQSYKSLIIVVHCNHSNEIDQSVIDACKTITKHNITLLNQAVLLKGVNDSVDQLCQLSETLIVAGIIPYYLHLLDKVSGTHHFDVNRTTAIALIEAVKLRLPGYLVPKLVNEVAGTPSKTAVTAN
ncbi:MAG: EF-P beta-lysylation protein EpmB [Methyloprofundus sp.]|nr:EF-P beta-lysylation protein EpmB [Methyloprofundus sp.]